MLSDGRDHRPGYGFRATPTMKGLVLRPSRTHMPPVSPNVIFLTELLWMALSGLPDPEWIDDDP